MFWIGCAESACSGLRTAVVHFESRGCPEHSHGELVVTIGSRLSGKTVNSVGRDFIFCVTVVPTMQHHCECAHIKLMSPPQNWFDKFEFLQFEFNRFQIYSASLTSNLPVEFNAPLPSGLVPSPSISTLATPGSNEMASWKSRSITPPHSPPSRNKLGHRSPTKRVSQGGSPLLSSRGQHS